jgi:hypothetical protein
MLRATDTVYMEDSGKSRVQNINADFQQLPLDLEVSKEHFPVEIDRIIGL